MTITSRQTHSPVSQTRRLIIGSLPFILPLVFLLVAFSSTRAQTFTVLHRFTGNGDGEAPMAGLTQDPSGNLYGTAMNGGAFDMGIVFQIPPGAKEGVFQSFWGGAGMLPEAPLIQDGTGNLYGTTYDGGTLEGGACLHGCGTVFKLDSAGKETVLYAFTGGTDGGNPDAGLVRDKEGNLYGITTGGGSSNCPLEIPGCGVVFKLDTSGKETVLHAFTASNGDGGLPNGGLVQDGAGNLYGVTETTCGWDCTPGTIFRVSPAGKETILHYFNEEDGAVPSGTLVLDSEGNLYGEAEWGGNLSSCSPGEYRGCGVVFKLDTAGKETVLYAFTSSEGMHPAGGLVRDKAGNLYGATLGSLVNEAPYGTIFRLAENGQLTTLHTFTGASDGAVPNGGLIIGKSGALYGTTQAGGDVSCSTQQWAGCGVVFKLTP